MRLFPKQSLVSVLLGAAAISCAGAPKVEPAAPETARPPPPVATAPAPVGPEMLPAEILARLDDESAATYFARRGDEGLAFYATHQHWYTRATGANGAPKAPEAREVAVAASDPTMASVKAVGDGYLAVWAERVAKNHSIKVLALDLDGKPRGEPTLVTQVTDDVTWLDVLPNKKGALVVWEVPHDERLDVFVAAVTDAGKAAGAATPVAQGVVGWEARATERGVALAMVTSEASAAPAKKGKRRPAKTADEASARGSKLGRVLFTEVDDKGKPGASVVVSAEPTAQLDVAVAEVGGKFVLAWTDERNIDACVYLAVAEPGGKIAVAPHRATAPFGEQALVSMVAESWSPGATGSKRALVAWEDQLRAPRSGRLIHLATLGADGALGKERGTLVFSASGAPDLVPDGDGFAAVTLAPVHDLPDGVTARPQFGVKGDPVWASFVRLGADLSVLASEPVRAAPFVDTDGVPYITRTLTCGGGTCTTLGLAAATPAKGPDSPAVAAPFALITLPKRQTPWKAPAFREADEAPPRASTVTALYDGDHLARVSATDLPGGGALAGWVTYVLEAGARGKRGKPAKESEEGQSATLGVRALGPDGTPGKPVILSTKAVSIGGVALASAPGKDGKKAEAAAAWVARVRGEPQVFVTKLGPDGEKLAEKGVTVIPRKQKGKPTTEASDVALAYAGGEGSGGDGWITAWVDTRDGNAEVYVAKLDRGLSKVVPDKRLTEAPGDAADVQLVVRGKDVFVVWSDARAKPEDGSGDIYLARLDAATLKKTGPETRLFASATHSRTPQILPTSKGFVVAWIEEGEAGKGDEGAGVRIAELDEKGVIIGAPQLVPAIDGQGTVTSATLGCTARACRGVLTTAVGEALLLGAFEMAVGEKPGPVKTIAALTGGANQDVSPAFAGSSATSLFFADDAVSGAGRVRWMKIAWP